MSERRRLESTIRDAATAIDKAVAEIEDAREYLGSYQHLQAANPLLDRILAIDAAELRSKAKSLERYTVLS